MKTLIFAILLCFVPVAFAGEPEKKKQEKQKQPVLENYCDDKQAADEWNAIALKYPDDLDTQMLHALRLGLCVKIKEGTISLDKAIDTFNDAHATVIERARQRDKAKAEANQKS